MIAIVSSGTPSVSMSITRLDVGDEAGGAGDVGVALKTLSPVPTTGGPARPSAATPESPRRSTGWYFSGSSWSETIADTSNR